ncbi:hypothetical protein [Marinicella sp. W31]|uniref:hypothetical protein n=1 Tax=Marinicella sp. W31 TaxID=3023713 RepID=UPI003757602B
MSFLLTATLIIVGLVAAARKIGDLAPGTKESLKYLTDSENWIGLVSTFIGLYFLIRFLRYIGYIGHAIFSSMLALVSILILIILGILLAQKLYVQWAGGNEKVAGFFNKFASIFDPFREILGLAAIVLGILNMIF